MNENEIILPSKEEVILLLNIAKNDKTLHMQTVNELLGMKWVDSPMPKTKGEPKWEYEGLRKFFINHSIDFSSTFEQALETLNI